MNQVLTFSLLQRLHRFILLHQQNESASIPHLTIFTDPATGAASNIQQSTRHPAAPVPDPGLSRETSASLVAPRDSPGLNAQTTGNIYLGRATGAGDTKISFVLPYRVSISTCTPYPGLNLEPQSSPKPPIFCATHQTGSSYPYPYLSYHRLATSEKRSSRISQDRSGPSGATDWLVRPFPYPPAVLWYHTATAVAPRRVSVLTHPFPFVWCTVQCRCPDSPH